ncbi:MAG: hypothetical protein ACRCXL_01960 [Dermatophilaceae bacterium]
MNSSRSSNGKNADVVAFTVTQAQVVAAAQSRDAGPDDARPSAEVAGVERLR